LQEVQLGALLGLVERWMTNVRDEPIAPHVRRDDASGLKLRRQEAIAPKGRAHHNLRARPQDNIPRQILVFRSKPIEEPGTQRGTNRLLMTGVHLQQGWLMVWNIGMQRADDTTVVNQSRQLGQALAHLNAALPVAVEAQG
jgi:hypothetical protein